MWQLGANKKIPFLLKYISYYVFVDMLKVILSITKFCTKFVQKQFLEFIS